MAVVLFSTGNFSYAVSHMDCIIGVGLAHHECEMECCVESDCCTGEELPESAVESIGSEKCCEIHIDQAGPQDYAILQFAKTNEIVKTNPLNTADVFISKKNSEYFNIFTHRFKTTNIYLSVSNLRI